jgi:hypothetical protein
MAGASSKWAGFSDEQARQLNALVARFERDLEALRAPDRVLDRRQSSAAIRPRPGDVVRAVAGDVVVLPHPRSAKGRAPVTVLAEAPGVVVISESSTVNDVERLTLTSTGAMNWYSTGTEWWGSAVGGSDGSGAPSGGPLGDQPGLSVMGVPGAATGPVEAITATAENQRLVSNSDATALEWVRDLPLSFFDVLAAGTYEYELPAGFRDRDTMTFQITGNVTLNALFLDGGVPPPDGFEAKLALIDQSGGSAPGHSFSIADAATGLAGQFRTPGQVQGTSPGPDYVMRSEEEACSLSYQNNNWRILGGTAAQAIEGDITVLAGNGSTRTAAITAGVIVNADVNASAAIAQTKLGATTGFSVKASGASATTSAEPIITYTTSANMSAERVATDTTTIDVDIGTAGQVRWNVILSAAYAWTGGHSWNTVGDFTVTAAVVGLTSNSSLGLDSVGDMTLQSDGDLILTGDEVRVRSNGTGGFLTFDAATASTPGLAASEGMYWVEDPGAAATIPRFTDDSNVDWQLLTYDALSVDSGNGEMGNTVTFYRTITAGTPGTAGDTVFFSGDAPWAMRIIASGVDVTTGSGVGDTVTLRTATGGGGNALSSAMSTVTSGTVDYSTGYTGVATVAAGGTVVARWTDRAAVGTFWFTAVRTG